MDKETLKAFYGKYNTQACLKELPVAFRVTVPSTSKLNSARVSLANHFQVTRESSCKYVCTSMIWPCEMTLATHCLY